MDDGLHDTAVVADELQTVGDSRGDLSLEPAADSRDDSARVLANVGLGPRPPPRQRPLGPGYPWIRS
jgi:hypothetical protein